MSSLKGQWSLLTANQKVVAIGIITLIVFGLASSWINTFSTWRELRVEKKAKAKAIKEANNALKKAAKIASDLKKRESELKILESKKEEKKKDVEKSKKETIDARNDYDRVVRESRTDNPSTDQLCDELKELGYECKE